MDAELRFHLDSRVEELVQSGMTSRDAELQARREFGPLDLIKDDCRDHKPAEWLAIAWRDVRHACRFLRRSPGFTAAAIATVALGVGANAAIVGVVYAALIRPLPYADPARLYAVDVVMRERAAEFPTVPATVQIYRAWRDATTAFSGMAALSEWEVNLTGDGEPERLGGANVSANFFDVLGVPVALGRGFHAEEEQQGREFVVVISDGLWRRRYGADPSIVGRVVSINGRSYTIVGVAAPQLLVPTGSQLNPIVAFASRIDVWRPIAPTPRELSGESESWDHGVIARLRPGENVERGRQQLQAILAPIVARKAPGQEGSFEAHVFPLRDVYAGRLRARLLLVFAASAVLLAVSCVNLANLVLARIAGRSAEFATRVALGASRSRVLTLILSEAIVVTLAGGLVGAVVAQYVTRALIAYGPGELAAVAGSRPTIPVFLFALAASVATGLVCGLWPGRHAHRRAVAAALQEGGRTAVTDRRASRARQILVGAEIALVMVLLASAALLLRSFVNLVGADRGYQIERVLAVDLSLFGQRYDSGESRTAFYRTLAEQVRDLPGVIAAGTISDLPAVAKSSGASRAMFLPTDSDSRLALTRPVAMVRSVTPGYFAASGTRIVAGRVFGDTESMRVGVISESLARALWPGRRTSDAVGQELRQGAVRGEPVIVLGVVADVRSAAGAEEGPPIIYRPHAQWASGPGTLVVKTTGEPDVIAPAVRRVIRRLDPNLPIASIRTLREVVSSEVAARRFQVLLTLAFAVVALLLGMVGVYGVLRFTVACRTRDIGLRKALGAADRDVVRFVLSYGMRPVLAGLAVGFAGAAILVRVLRSQLYGLSATDASVVIGAAALLVLTAGFACYLPARRAARLDPVIALRHE
jgi:putative ABC transport system permease protein